MNNITVNEISCFPNRMGIRVLFHKDGSSGWCDLSWNEFGNVIIYGPNDKDLAKEVFLAIVEKGHLV